MALPKALLVALASASLTLGGGATGFPAQVSRFQAMPAPQGQSFAIVAADPADRGGLEFGHYAAFVRSHMAALGYAEGPSPEAAALLVSFDYGVDHGRQEVRSWPSSGPYGGYGGFGYGRFGYHGGWGRGYYAGWDDPFWFGGDIETYTIFTSFLDLDIKRAADGRSVFEGTARAHSRSDDLQRLVPNLVEAIFTGFPGHSGETVRITVPPPGKTG